MFSHPNPVIVQIRRELRGQLPDEWLEEVVSILEYQLSYQTLDELATNDLLKLKLGAGFSATLQKALLQLMRPPSLPTDLPSETSFPSPLPWQ
ncbi:hypothetical protein H6F76_28060 [Leptolyngbya sp. FACHB-321]|uniref:hypothetical protein n=1 Tax=Leptolyngbya sp. FACHB-321 TaxID=2692807 RepID=UPI001685F604|nr:hypothetical protein [Leptolyngbya sp. FACHB-321]MBD2038811.1 hypothetical protein [Leptolyngbya sp. FACHB-321]